MGLPGGKKPIAMKNQEGHDTRKKNGWKKKNLAAQNKIWADGKRAGGNQGWSWEKKKRPDLTSKGANGVSVIRGERNSRGRGSNHPIRGKGKGALLRGSIIGGRGRA